METQSRHNDIQSITMKKAIQFILFLLSGYATAFLANVSWSLQNVVALCLISLVLFFVVGLMIRKQKLWKQVAFGIGALAHVAVMGVFVELVEWYLVFLEAILLGYILARLSTCISKSSFLNSQPNTRNNPKNT